MTIEYIYDPQIVDKVLQGYPLLRQGLGDPAQEGQKAVSFPQCRKTRREIYRILSNQHYPHLVELLKLLEYCIVSGWEQPTLLKTRGQKEFGSSVAELFVAGSFLKRGLKVRGFDQSKGAGRVPDMLIESGTLSMSVEVYCPRDWNGLYYFLEEMRLGILHLDVPWDFYFEISMELINDFCPEGKSLWFDPWQFSKVNENPADRWAKIRPILSQIETNLSGATRAEIVACLPNEDLNVLFEVRLFQIQKSQGHTPARIGTVSGPTLSGYAPEGMFDRLVERRILKKIQKGQAQSLQRAHFRALIVDISRLGYTSEFTHPYYLQQFGQSVEKHMDSEELDVDLVVFCFPRSEPKADMAIPVLFRKPSLSDENFGRLFGGNRSFSALSEEVFIEKR